VGATDLSFTADPTVGSFANWPTGGGGPFCIALDQGFSTFEKVLCSGFNPANGVFTVYQAGAFNGRGYDGTAGVGHVPQANIPQIILTWTAVEAGEINEMIVQVMAGAVSGSAGQVLTIEGGIPTWQTPGGSNAGLMPIGGILLWALGTGYPTGFLECNGQLISQTTYATLFGILGTTYGSGSGTFGLPNFRDKYPVGYHSGGIASTVGATGGSRTISQANLPSYALPVTDGGHYHTPGGAGTTFVEGVGSSTYYLSTSASAQPVSLNLTTQTDVTGITVASGGSGVSYDVPFLGMAYLMRCL
jgi:microcystin-dependent protein